MRTAIEYIDELEALFNPTAGARSAVEYANPSSRIGASAVEYVDVIEAIISPLVGTSAVEYYGHTAGAPIRTAVEYPAGE